MFETVASTENYVASFVNTTTTLATTAAMVFDYNATEFWNVSGGDDDEANRSNSYHHCDPVNTEFNCTEEEFLSFYMGSKQMPLETAVWVSSSIFIPGTLLFSQHICIHFRSKFTWLFSAL